MPSQFGRAAWIRGMPNADNDNKIKAQVGKALLEAGLLNKPVEKK